MSRNLYHYCSLDAFVKIILNKCIRLSDVSKSNDFMERNWAFSILKKPLINFFKDKNLDIDLMEHFDYGNGINNHLEYIMSEVKLRNDYLCFTTCFSDKGDILSQWRGYGDDGYGLSIGFNYSLLGEISQGESAIILDEVCYEEQEQEAEIRYAAECALEHAKLIANEKWGFDAMTDNAAFSKWLREEMEVFGERFADYMRNVNSIIKNPAFAEEREWRLFYNSNINKYAEDNELTRKLNSTQKVDEYDLMPVKFYARNKQIISYMDLSFENRIEDNIISEVVIGPSSKISVDDIRLYLVKCGYQTSNIRISKSNASYRPK